MKESTPGGGGSGEGGGGDGLGGLGGLSGASTTLNLIFWSEPEQCGAQ